MNAEAHPGSTQGRTLMGAAAPPELQAYQAQYRASQNGMSPAQGYPQQMTPQGMNAMHQSGQVPMMNPSGQMEGMNPSNPSMPSCSP